MRLGKIYRTHGIIQDQQNINIFTGSTGQMGLDVINRTNGIRQSQGHRRDCAVKPNIGQTTLNSGKEDLNR
jgi:hypothetical protein